MSRYNIEKLLQTHHLRNTAIRREILSIFQDLEHAVSHQFLETKLGANFDRVTIYRTLKTFEEAKLIHRVLTDENAVSYALCREACEHQHEGAHKHSHTHDHVHFKCDVCQLTFCLEQTSLPNIDLPKNYRPRHYQVLVEGVCDKCQV